jgi:hypothetical protein
MEYQIQRSISCTCVQKHERRGMQKTENRPNKTRNRGNIGKANLYNVISYGSKNSFVKDENKHFAGSNYDKPKYGFLFNQAKRFDVPIPIRGKLGFFDVELNGFRLLGQVQRTLEIFHARGSIK